MLRRLSLRVARVLRDAFAAWCRIAFVVPLVKKDARTSQLAVAFTLAGSPTCRNYVGPVGSAGMDLELPSHYSPEWESYESVTARAVGGGREQPQKTEGGDRRHELLACLPLLPAKLSTRSVREWFCGWRAARQTGALKRRKKPSKPLEICFPHEYYLRLSRRVLESWYAANGH